MTTPEQLAKWREEFESVCLGVLEIVKLSNGTYADSRTEAVWQWHISAKQETEQIMKLAKFGAMVAKSHADGDFIEAEDLTSALIASGAAVEHIKGKIDYAPFTEATIKGLLND